MSLVAFSDFTFADLKANLKVTSTSDSKILIGQPSTIDLQPWIVSFAHTEDPKVNLIKINNSILTKRHLDGRILEKGESLVINFDFNSFLPNNLPKGSYYIVLIYRLGGFHCRFQSEVTI